MLGNLPFSTLRGPTSWWNPTNCGILVAVRRKASLSSLLEAGAKAIIVKKIVFSE